MTESHLYVSAATDRYGQVRWRFRRAGKSLYLPGQPGEPAFEAAYLAAIEGREIPKPPPAEISTLPGQGAARSLRAAWALVPRILPEWHRLEPETRDRQDRIAAAFLASPVTPDSDLLWGDVPVSDIRRRHVKMLLSERAETPHAARHLLVVIRRMVLVGLDEEWIETDPTHRVKHRPDYVGWKAWPESARRAYESRWPVGSTPRLAYALALWLGNRRGDVVTLAPSAIEGDTIRIVQGKTGREIVLDITPMLREVLDAADLSGPTILKTQYGQPFSAKSLTGRMRDWTRAAGLPQGHTLHGLRKTLGKMLAEGGATTRQIMDTLGHTDIQHAELYTREADQKRLARAGMQRVVRLVSSGPGKRV